MRYLNILLGLTMVGFTAVQYNDPDALLWVVYYMVPAIWALLVAFRLDVARSTLGSRLLLASVAVWLGLVIYYWPQVPNFWRQDVFMAEETAREGMGLMVGWGVLLVALFTARAKKALGLASA